MTTPGLSQRGFTLLELLVASAIGMVVMYLAISAYHQSQRQINRAEVLLRMHRAAGDIASQWELDANALVQTSACNVTTTTTGPGGSRNLVRFTGLCSAIHGYTSSRYEFPRDTDTSWVRWEWNASSHRLTRAQTPPPHWVTWYPQSFLAYIEQARTTQPVIGMRPNAVRDYGDLTSGLKSWTNIQTGAGSTRIYDLLFLTGVDADGTTRSYAGFNDEMAVNGTVITPFPLQWVNYPWEFASRSLPWPGTSTVVATSLNSALFITGTTTPQLMSAGTWSTVPVPDPRRTLGEDISECTVTVVSRSGATASNQDFVGEPQDGRDSAVFAARPDKLRLSFTMTDRTSGIRQSFSFSAKAPR